VLLGLPTENSIGLALVAGIFVVFALLAALVIPRRWPQFPGEQLRWFIVATLVLFVATLGAVEVFAKEDEPAEEAVAGETETETGEEGPGMTITTQEPPPPAEQPPPPAAEGDPAAGKQIFTDQGCGGCHTFSAAGTDASLGPNLDEALEGKDAEFVRESIVDPDAEVASGFQAGIMPKDFGDKLSEKQLNDLVAFLTQG
jgi:mono/diheme cytochrome c family protein